jgi:hypothetical protein
MEVAQLKAPTKAIIPTLHEHAIEVLITFWDGSHAAHAM